jgi:hypothetical protein
MSDPPRSNLCWTDHHNGFWTATGPTGIPWETREFGYDGDMRFGITVAHWDHPDWWARTLQEAKSQAAEIDARPPIPPEEWVNERPCVAVGDGEDYAVAYETALAPPSSACPSCGSTAAAIAMKPRRHTAAWWDDPLPFWRCPTCESERGSLDEWPYSISREEFFASIDHSRAAKRGARSRVRRWMRRRRGQRPS